MIVTFKDLTIPKLKEEGEVKILNIQVNESSLLVLPPSRGKTFLFEHIIGLRKKFDGEIQINGIKVDLELDSGFFSLRKKIGILFEKPVFLSNLNLEDNLKLILKNSDHLHTDTQIHEIVHESLKRFRIQDCALLRPAEMTQNQLKVGAFLMAIIHEPHLLIWDEPHMNFPDDVQPIIKNELNKLKERNGLMLGFSSSEVFAQENQLQSVVL